MTTLLPSESDRSACSNKLLAVLSAACGRHSSSAGARMQSKPCSDAHWIWLAVIGDALPETTSNCLTGETRGNDGRDAGMTLLARQCAVRAYSTPEEPIAKCCARCACCQIRRPTVRRLWSSAQS